MDLNWFQSIFYGFFSGLTEILPVSARAHSIILLKIFGAGHSSSLSLLLNHLGILAGLYVCSLTSIIRVFRAVNLARIPKKRRKRPLDTKSLMDFRLWRTMILPVLLAYVFYDKLSFLDQKLFIVSFLIFLNGIVLYIPQFLPGCNKDSRSLSRIDGILMGLGSALSVFPGISGIGTSVSVGAVRGVQRTYAFNLAIMVSVVATLCLIVFDITAIASTGLGFLSVGIVLKMLVSALAAFAGVVIGVSIMRTLAESIGFHIFSYYCWGLALFAFILNLMA